MKHVGVRAHIDGTANDTEIPTVDLLLIDGEQEEWMATFVPVDSSLTSAVIAAFWEAVKRMDR